MVIDLFLLNPHTTAHCLKKMFQNWEKLQHILPEFIRKLQGQKMRTITENG